MAQLWRFFLIIATFVAILGQPAGAAAQYFNGFEDDTAGWDAFGPSLEPARVASGTGGVTSSSGDWHALADGDATNFGGYHCDAWPGDWFTELDIWIDGSLADGSDRRLNWTVAVTAAQDRNADGVACDHVVDQIFHVGTKPGLAGMMVASHSQNCPGWPSNPGWGPQDFPAQTGWYRLRHEFAEGDDGNLWVSFLIIRLEDDTVVASWSHAATGDADPTVDADGDGNAGNDYFQQIPVSILGGNRYGWFCGFSNWPLPLPIDNSRLGFFTVDVLVDVRPQNAENQVNTNARQLVPIAILGAEGFDPCESIDPSSVVAHGAYPASTSTDCEDVNGDGFVDLVLQYRARKMDPPTPEECGDPDARLVVTGFFFDGTPLVGSDHVTWLGPDCS